MGRKWYNAASSPRDTSMPETHSQSVKLEYEPRTLRQPSRALGFAAGGLGAGDAGFLVLGFLDSSWYWMAESMAIWIGLAAIVVGVLGMANGRSRLYRFGILLSFAGFSTGTLAAAGALSLPSPYRVRCDGNRPKCGSQLRQIGQAMMLYALDHQNHYPDAIDGLLEEDISTAVFVCPSSNDTPAAPGP